ncbi:PREDICTED: anaphase-promoting complex subunit 1-like, partial [Priapulus caudatus]|uniref:Anaphase-promoting complex subunit 1-like n=1 Tax=Priapulus caudatus TaxID=37621 RepID=A0ABM1F6A2_PRICU
ALKLQFGEDLRVAEVRKLLQSARPVKVTLVQRPEVSDHEFIEEQERHLLSICQRTMALPLGRGMFTLSTSTPIVTETLPVPKLCLTGRAPPRNTILCACVRACVLNVDNEALKLQFGEDLRVAEVRKLLQSARPVKVTLVQRPEVSDHEFIEEQERHLLSICQRTMALPLGRGMFTLSTSTPIVTETLPVPKLCLTGRAPPRNTTVDLTHIDVPANMNAWPLFHNGVAAGLRIQPQSSGVSNH